MCIYRYLIRGCCYAVAVVLATGIFAMCLPAFAHASNRYEVGISTSASLLWMNDRDLDTRLKDIKNLGATWIRIDFSWAAIQPHTAREYSWEKYDRVVAAANAYDIKVLALLGYTPEWARDPRCRAVVKYEKAAQKCSPRSVTEFSAFAKAAVVRYRQVEGWEIWNEPNLTSYWKTVQADGSTFVDPVSYALVANAAAAEIRRHSDAVIITGGLSPLFEPNRSRGMRQSDYLAQMLRHLDPGLFDGIGMHPYSWPVLPSRAAQFNAFYTIDNGRAEHNLRTTMNAAGWTDKQIWGTEYGASTKGKQKTYSTNQARPDHVSEDFQARIISEGVANWYIKPNVGPLFIHADSDQWLAAHKNEGGFGLRRSDGTKKPAYESLKSATQEIRRRPLSNRE